MYSSAPDRWTDARPAGRRLSPARADRVVWCVAPTRPRSARLAPAAARGSRAGRAGRAARAARASRARAPPSACPAATPHWRRLSTHTTRADIMIWRQSKYSSLQYLRPDMFGWLRPVPFSGRCRNCYYNVCKRCSRFTIRIDIFLSFHPRQGLQSGKLSVFVDSSYSFP